MKEERVGVLKMQQAVKMEEITQQNICDQIEGLKGGRQEKG